MTMKAFFIVLVVSFASLSSFSRTSRESRDSKDSIKTTIIFTGDILLDRGVRQVIERRGADRLFTKQMDSLFRSVDVVVGNLECPATHIKAPTQKRFIFRAEPEWLKVLKKHGITHLNLANNHAIDQGRQGLMDTKVKIQQAGMTPIGAGRNMSEAAQPVLLTQQPRNVWLVSSLRLALENYAYLTNKPCVSQEPMDSLISRIKTLRRQDAKAVIIVSLHWGGENTKSPVPSQRLEAHRLITAGADALICHHTHTLQTIEHYRGHDIYYSIGNFIFDQQKPINTEACLVKVNITKDNVTTTSIPITIKNCIPCIIH